MSEPSIMRFPKPPAPRHVIHGALGALALLLLAVASVDAAGRRPNIVIILADDMGFSDIGCYGGEIRTPHLDRLAREGVRFTQFYNTGRCCPTRASLLTGLYSHRAGIGHMTQDRGFPSYRGHLSDGAVTIAEVLGGAGYHTVMTGKWHVGGHPSHWPLERGFDRFYGIPEGGGFYFRLRPGRSLVIDDRSVTPPEDWYVTDAFSDRAVGFLDEVAETDRPFFLYVAHIAPHWPLQARPEDISRYRGKYTEGWAELRKRRHRRLLEMGIVDPKWPLSPLDTAAAAWEELSDEERDEMDLRMAVYAAQIEVLDRGVGRILEKLAEIGAERNTLVLFLSDNGASAEGGALGFTRGEPGARTGTAGSYASYGLSWANASNTPFRRYKSQVHEGGIATPLIARWPAGIGEERRGDLERRPAHVIDLMATCLDLAGVEYPATWEGREVLPLDGRSLRPALEGKPAEKRSLFWEHQGNRAVRSGRWKLVAPRGGDWELYDLEVDRTELRDLSRDDPDRVRELAALWERWAKRSGVLPWEEVREGRKRRTR